MRGLLLSKAVIDHIVFRSKRNTHLTKMSTATFVQRLNPLKGVSEWVVGSQDGDDYDYHMEIARSAYADMLHDHDRNMKYYKGLELTIAALHARNEKAIVLDIGTGSGLLSMMAAKLGADEIFACEAFEPMASCALRVIKQNGYTDHIKVIRKRSTELVVGIDLPVRANILVTEVFDTELIGEGALSTFNHAHAHLLTDPCYVIPSRAVFYAQVVRCELVPKWNTLQPIQLPNGSRIQFPPQMSSCSGVPSVHDVQLSEIKTDNFEALSSPIPVFHFDWESNKAIPLNNSTVSKFISESSCTDSMAIFSWWDLEMTSLDPSTIITMRPSWSSTRGESAWRDHWMMCIYNLPTIHLTAGQEYELHSHHDEFSLWFGLNESIPERPICECGVHLTLSRNRIGLFNDTARNEKYIQVLEKSIVPKESVVLVLSEGSSLGFIAAGLGAKTVFVLESAYGTSMEIMTTLYRYNGFTNVIMIESVKELEFQNDKIDVVVADPFYRSSVLPWHSLHYWHALQQAKTFLKPGAHIFPSKGKLQGMLVHYKDLWKIKAPVHAVCNGDFNLMEFDKLVLSSSDEVDSELSAEYLWEYPSLALSKPQTLMEFDLTRKITAAVSKGEFNGALDYTANGLALWMAWTWSNDVELSNGPINIPVSIGNEVLWDKYNKQGVYLFREDQCDAKGEQKDVTYKVNFDSTTGEVEFDFVRN